MKKARISPFVLTVLAYCIGATISERCTPDLELVVPTGHDPQDSAAYEFHESGTQVFMDYEIPCDGELTSWEFMSDLETFQKVHFAVFRETSKSTADKREFQIVGETYLAQAPSGWAKDSWTPVFLANPIPVQQGDRIGIFYDSYRIFADKVVIPSKGDVENGGQTFVYLLDASTLTNGTATGPFQEKNRVPALNAIITGSGSGSSNSLVELPSGASDYPIFIFTTEETTTKKQDTGDSSTTASIAASTTTVTSSRCSGDSPSPDGYTCGMPRSYYRFLKDLAVCTTINLCSDPKGGDDSDQQNLFETLEECKAECPTNSMLQQYFGMKPLDFQNRFTNPSNTWTNNNFANPGFGNLGDIANGVNGGLPFFRLPWNFNFGRQ